MPIKKVWCLASAFVASLAIASPAFGATAPAPAPVAPLDESACAHQAFSQSLLSYGDTNNYVLAPGGAFSNALDWQLAGGATLTTTTQPDGTAGGVLQLPSKSMATSPVMCITDDYPTARVFGRNVSGGDKVYLNTQYWNGKEWAKPKDQGGFTGDKSKWALSDPLPLTPSATDSWQQVRFTFYAGGKNSTFQVDDFWVDPRASR